MKGEYDPMRRMKQLLAAGLMMSVLATMSGGDSSICSHAKSNRNK